MRTLIAIVVVTMLGCRKPEDAGDKPAPASAGAAAAAGSAGSGSGGSNMKAGPGSGGSGSGAPAVTAGAGSAADPSPAKPDVAPHEDAGVAPSPLGKTVMSDETIGGVSAHVGLQRCAHVELQQRPAQ